MSYSNARSAAYHFNAQAVGSAATLKIAGPAGAEGRLIGISAIVTTVLAGAGAAVISVGNSGDADAQGTLTIPAAAAVDSVHNTVVRGVDNRIDADSGVEIDIDGGPTSGNASITVLIDWYGGDAS